MTGPATGERAGGTGAPKRSTTILGAASAILLVLALGLAFRIILALTNPGSGFGVDLQAFRFWAGNLAEQGPFGFYERDFFHDYTPGYLYVLWLIGIVGRAAGDIGDLIKIPAVVADIALGWLVWSMARELGAGRRAAVLGGAIVVANPITWFDSVVWGQVDSVGVVFLLLGLRELWRDRTERAAVLTVVAATIKPQLGILVPLVAAVTIRRAFWPAGGFGDDPTPAEHEARGDAVSTFGWERRAVGPARIVTTGLAGLLTAVVLSAGFGLSIIDLAEQVGTAAATYPYLSVNAYNPWALLELNGSGIAASGQWVCDMVIPASDAGPGCGEAFHFGPLPAIVVGTALLLVTLLAVTLMVARRPDRRTMLVGLAVLAVAFFVVPTRVHGRYLFPFFAVAAILAAVSIRWRLAYVVLSVATFANMYAVLTTLYPDNPGIEDWLGIGQQLRSPAGVTVAALAHLGGFAWAVAQLRNGALRRLRREIADTAAGDPAGDLEPATLPDPDEQPRSWTPPTEGGHHRRPARRAVEARYRLPTWSARPELGRAGFVGWLRGRLFDRPVRPDRTATLRGERGGRLDRLDLWIVVVLVLAALTLRFWRLAEPHRMHFDEVYHARTATEFLQHWRYGLSHDIYEWTHPHLAKYAMAGGIVAWGGDAVTGTAELGVPVTDAVVEPRWEDALDRAARFGDRLHVATGDEVRSYDLRTRELVARVTVPGATRLALDQQGHRLHVATEDGTLLSVDLAALDAARRTGTPPGPGVHPYAQVGGPVRLLHVTDGGATVLAALDDGPLVGLDALTGDELGRSDVGEIAALEDAGTVPVLVARPAEVPDPADVAAELAPLLGGEAGDYEPLLGAEQERVVLSRVEPSGDVREAIDAAIAEDRLPGVVVDSTSRVAAATPAGVVLVSASEAEVLQTVALPGGAQGLALVEGIDDPKLYVTTAGSNGPRYHVMTVGGEGATGTVTAGGNYPLPGAGSVVRWNDATQQVHIVGSPPENRSEAGGATVYVIEPHANAVYADAQLPFEPAAVVIDANALFPSSAGREILALSASGAVAAVDAGSHALGWRIPGVLAGILMAALVYVLARILFARRSVAVLVGVLVLVDGMLFVQSRIAMNDAYVALFIVAAYTLFAGIWTGWTRFRGAFWVLMPVIGLLLGLALASKWVAAYAIGALAILILARSALGRVVLVTGMIILTTVLGYMAISVPEGETGNLTFMLIMIGLTLTAVVVTVLHPIAWSIDEVRFAVGAPAAAGVGIALLALAAGRMTTEYTLGPIAASPLHVAFALALLSLAVAGLFWVAARAGLGPMAPPPGPEDPARLVDPAAPAADGWLRPGWALGLPVAWAALSLLAIPVAVYVVSYIPWAWIENHRIIEGLPAGHTGQTLLDLTGQMYAYHNNLSSAHAAASPWWAWPFDLKPVWFYQQSFAGGTAAAIYDAGNLVLWWLAVPAMAFVAWQAFRRRSLALALIAIAFACQWVPWARIDRAAFQYHYYTSLPFVALALAYFLAELWHGASRLTWLGARLAGAAAVIAPGALWLLHRPLCGFVRVNDANPGSQACPTLIPEFVLTWRTLAVAVVVLVAVIVLVRQFLDLDRPDARSSRSPLGEWGALTISAAVATVALIAVGVLFPEEPLFTARGVAVEPIAVLVLIPLLAGGLAVASARDARRFTLGAMAAIVVFFVVWYPNLSGLPLPSQIVNAYQGFLPTYLYPFQFPVSTVDRSIAGPSLLSLGPAILLAALTAACLIVAYSAWTWRIALAERALAEDPETETETGPGPALGTSGG
ncbi:MAG TPA: phospholipid carrier-dependent glycosyltransferase [Vitreimonas sp.]|nr:phospholipid carrier-dependent glycosyltransferase [Vitreimonas sp.]